MPVPAQVSVSLDSAGTTYSRDVFGHFIEHFHRQIYGGLFEPGSRLADQHGFRTDVIEALRELRPSVVRWPGGCFASSYHWLDGVGPKRQPFYDKAWRVSDPNTFGTKEFIDWCAAIGAEPYICTNAGTGNSEEMSDWVEYCNSSAGTSRWADLRAEHGSPQPFNVKYWSIGNENYGDWEMGAKTAEEWASLVRESAKMMLHVDEDLELLTAARADLDWMLPLLNASGRYINMLSIHGYWDPLSQVEAPSDYLTALSRSLEPQTDIERAKAIIVATGLSERVGIAFDEWNLRGWHHPNGNHPDKIAARDANDINSVYTMADALFSASFLNTCLRNADMVKMANIAPTINTRGPLFVHKDGIVKRTTFHVMAMYANLLGKRVLPSSALSSELLDAGVPLIDQLATVDEAGRKVSLVLLNRDPYAPVACDVFIAGHRLDGHFATTVLDGPSPDAYNDVHSPETVTPRATRAQFTKGRVSLPPHSLCIVQVDLPVTFGAGSVSWQPTQSAPWRASDKGWYRNAG